MVSYRKVERGDGPRGVHKRRSGLCAVGMLLSALLFLADCSGSGAFSGKASPVYPGRGPLPKGGGKYLVGDAYSVSGHRFRPKIEPNYDSIGIASWYGAKFDRHMTSNGEWFDMRYPSAAHTTLPLPSYAKVTNLENGRKIIVRVNDRGPFVKNRIIDLSAKAAGMLGLKSKGTAKVRVQYVGKAPLNDTGRHLAAMNAELRRGTSLKHMIAAADRRSNGTPYRLVAHVIGRSTVSGKTRSSLKTRFYVQAAAFANPVNARRAKGRLSSLGPVRVSIFSRDGHRFYRVCLGPLSDPRQAEKTWRQVIAAGHPGAFIVPASDRS